MAKAVPEYMMTEVLSMGYYGYCEQVLHGQTCRNAFLLLPPVTADLVVG
jgi:hypothetical protein